MFKLYAGGEEVHPWLPPEGNADCEFLVSLSSYQTLERGSCLLEQTSANLDIRDMLDMLREPFFWDSGVRESKFLTFTLPIHLSKLDQDQFEAKKG